MNSAYLETLLNPLPVGVKAPLIAFVREAFKTLRFGAPDADAAVSSENFAGHLVPFTTSSVANAEVAVAHGLGHVPRWVMPGLDPNLVGSTCPVLTVTRVADDTYLYLSCPTTSVAVYIYAE